MIVKKPYMQMLLQEINIDDLRKKSNNQSNKLEAYVESVLFQSNFFIYSRNLSKYKVFYSKSKEEYRMFIRD